MILHASAAAPAATEELIVVKAQQATGARSLLWPRSGEKIGAAVFPDDGRPPPVVPLGGFDRCASPTSGE